MSPPLRSIVVPTYKLRPEVLVAYYNSLRANQKSAVASAKSFDHGQVLAPCGTGKTRIQSYLLADDMLAGTMGCDYGAYVIASHRLAPNMQLLDEVVDLTVKCGLPFDVVFCGSVNDNFDRYYDRYTHLGYGSAVSQYLFSTTAKEISSFVERAKSRNRHTLIASTYHSFDRLLEIGSITRATFDEAHNITQDNFTDIVKSVLPIINRKHFFTATRRVGDNNTGMDDKSLYGEILHQYIPSDALSDNEIACPMMHFIDAIDPNKHASQNNLTMLVENLKEAFIYHEQFIKSGSCQPNDIAAKLLVACGGVDEMMDIYTDAVFELFTMEHSIERFAISSEKGCWHNGVQLGRGEFMRKLRALKDTDRAIILNVDILTQGIDLPSITGVMPMRTMSKIQLLQLLGRCLRLHALDRERLYAGTIAKFSYLNGHPDNRVKPYGWIIIPRHLAQLDHHEQMVDIINAIIAEYKTPVDQLVIHEQYIDRHHDRLDSLIPMRRIHGAKYELVSTEADISCKVNLNNITTMFVIMSKTQYRSFLEEVGSL